MQKGAVEPLLAEALEQLADDQLLRALVEVALVELAGTKRGVANPLQVVGQTVVARTKARRAAALNVFHEGGVVVARGAVLVRRELQAVGQQPCSAGLDLLDDGDVVALLGRF
ncbi:hypothetical protein D3C78_995590 [compost metagenome]